MPRLKRAPRDVATNQNRPTTPRRLSRWARAREQASDTISTADPSTTSETRETADTARNGVQSVESPPNVTGMATTATKPTTELGVVAEQGAAVTSKVSVATPRMTDDAEPTPTPTTTTELVIAACRAIESTEPGTVARLDQLADAAGYSPHHFQKLFKAAMGVTPKQYAAQLRAGRARAALDQAPTVTDAIHDAGFSSTGRFYEQSEAMLGMTPTTYRQGAPGETIRFAVGECSLGSVLVAATEQGVCAILFGDDPNALAVELQRRFGKAEIVGADAAFEQTVAIVIGLIEQPLTSAATNSQAMLPLDIRGTAFQQRVWAALREIPAGETVGYREIAERIGQPTASRAVAQACGANHLAVAIPCHRVVRSGDGALGGYRWGVERKAALLTREGH